MKIHYYVHILQLLCIAQPLNMSVEGPSCNPLSLHSSTPACDASRVSLCKILFLFLIVQWVHDLLNELQRGSQWQSYDVVVISFYFLHKYRSNSLNAIPASFVCAFSGLDICQDQIVRHCIFISMLSHPLAGILLTRLIKPHRRLFDMVLHPIPWMYRVLPRCHDDHSSVDFMPAKISQSLQHGDMILLAPRLLQYLSCRADHDRVCGDYQRWLSLGTVELRLVDRQCLMLGCSVHVFERCQRLGEIFGCI